MAQNGNGVINAYDRVVMTVLPQFIREVPSIFPGEIFDLNAFFPGFGRLKAAVSRIILGLVPYVSGSPVSLGFFIVIKFCGLVQGSPNSHSRSHVYSRLCSCDSSTRNSYWLLDASYLG